MNTEGPIIRRDALKFGAACLGMLALPACDNRLTEANYYLHDNSIIVYFQKPWDSEKGYLPSAEIRFDFYDSGKYEVEFSSKDHENGKKTPSAFTVDVEDYPKTKIIAEGLLPEDLEVTVRKNGQEEAFIIK